MRTGEKAEEEDAEVDVDRVDDEVVAADDDRKEEGLDGVAVLPFAVAGVGVGVDSNRLPRVDLSEDAMLEAADAASFALSFSCRPRFVCGYSRKGTVCARSTAVCRPETQERRGGGEGLTRCFGAGINKFHDPHTPLETSLRQECRP